VVSIAWSTAWLLPIQCQALQTQADVTRALLGMVMGTSASLRTIVRIGSMRSMRPVSTRAPLPVATSTRSPTRNGCDRNCAATPTIDQSVSGGCKGSILSLGAPALWHATSQKSFECGRDTGCRDLGD